MDGPLLPDSWAFTQWLKGAVLISSSRLKDKAWLRSGSKLCYSDDYGDWLPVSAIVGYEEYLLRVLSLTTRGLQT
jgi:hypothetical protein